MDWEFYIIGCLVTSAITVILLGTWLIKKYGEEFGIKEIIGAEEISCILIIGVYAGLSWPLSLLMILFGLVYAHGKQSST